MPQAVTVYFLELTAPDQLRPGRTACADLRLQKVEIPLSALNRFFYAEVGRPWQWTDRLGWTDAQWAAWADRPQLHTWMATLRGTPAGYFELEQQPEGNVEIAHFGLLPAFTGRGLGGQALGAAAAQAWALGARRVWVHTCSLDHPRALANYLARGFRLYDEQTVRHPATP